MIKRLDGNPLDPMTFPAAPRTVRRSLSRGCALIGARLFILPHICVGVGVFAAIAGILAVLAFGHAKTAVVTKRTSSTSDDGETHHIQYRYGEDDGSRYVG